MKAMCLIVAGISLLAPRLAAQEPVVASQSNALWVAESKGTLKLSSSDGRLLFEVPSGAPVRAVAVDERRSTVWVFSDHTLTSFTFDGETGFSLPLALPATAHANLVVDGRDGSVLLAVGSELRAFTAAGQELFTRVLAANIVSLSLDETASLVWVATADGVFARDARNGQDVGALSLPANPRISAVTLDPASGAVWVARRDGVDRYSVGGAHQLTVAVSGAIGIAGLRDGGVWVASTKELQRLSSTGESSARVQPFGGAGSIRELEADAASGAAWVGTDGDIAFVSPAGVVSQILGFQPPIHIWDLALYADTLAPLLEIVAPLGGAFLPSSAPQIQLEWTDLGAGVNQQSLTVRDSAVPLALECQFLAAGATCQPVSALAEGTHRLVALVSDYAGNVSVSAEVEFVVDTVPPVISVLAPVAGSTTTAAETSFSGAVSEPGELVLAGAAIALGPDGAFAYGPLPLAMGRNEFLLVAHDRAGNETRLTIEVTRAAATGLPPDPATVASAIERSAITDIFDATRFLYEGADALQTGVVAGAIEASRVAILRGRVLARDGQPLPAVTITAHGHSEFGRTLSRADGMFDLVVNGGGQVVLDFARDGFIPVQREIATPWRGFAWADDVVLIAYDTAATGVAANAATVQVARGTAVTDERGGRRATLLFPAGLQMELEFSDGTRQPVPSLSVRATEFTVGLNGPQAMPAALPPTTGYTYAIELSADEVAAQGASRVQFSQPVALYLENFLEFPVGAIVPTGYYDRELASWIPSENGVIVKLTGISTAGLAELDVDGTGPAAPATLAALGITDDERRTLAGLYATGQTLWRVPVTHFTPYDCNWPVRVENPGDATKPPNPDGGNQEDEAPGEEREDNDSPAPDEENPECEDGSVIECENQVLGESIAVVGTPYRLNYRGVRDQAFRWSIRLSNSYVPASLRRIQMTVQIAGRKFSQEFAPQSNLRHTFVWDGKDAYGRVLQGKQRATVRVDYVYRQVVILARSAAQSFGFPPDQEVIIGEGREVFYSNQAERDLGIWDPRGQLMGSWNLSAQHVYDQDGKTLYLGSGERRQAGDVRWVSRTVAGRREFYSPGHQIDGGPALGFNFQKIDAVASAPDGSIYVGTEVVLGAFIRQVVYRITPDGTIHRFAGGGTLLTDGIPARDAFLNDADDLAVGKDGSVYIQTRTEIRRVAPDGRIWTVVGNLSRPSGIGLSPSGELFLVTQPASIFSGLGGIWRVTPQGRLGLLASTVLPVDVAADAAGNVYVCDNALKQIWRLEPNGRFQPYVGAGQDYPGDGGRAADASIPGCFSLDVARDGGLLFAEQNPVFIDAVGRARRVSPTGIMSTFAGGPIGPGRSSSFDREGGPAIGAPYSWLTSIAQAPDGSVLIASAGGSAFRVTSMFPGFSEDGVVLPSEDGHALYIFNGRHQQTRSALTGAVLLQFEYNDRGLLVGISDGSGNRTAVERDGGGRANALIAPFGQRTVLHYGPDELLSAVTNPAGESHQLTYHPNGLLASFKTPRGTESRFSYSTTDRLLADQDAAGGVKRLSRFVRGGGSYRVQVTSGEGRTKSHSTNRRAGGLTRGALGANGLERVSSQDSGGNRRTVSTSGAVSERSSAIDPRFGMVAPITRAASITTPSGLRRNLSNSRSVSLASPGDLLSLTSLEDTSFINGRRYGSRYQAQNRSFTLTTPAGRLATLSVDALLKPLTITASGMAPVRFSYDSHGRLAAVAQGSAGDERTVHLEYDELGWLASVTDPLSRTVAYEYDAAGRVTKQTLPDNRFIAFSYDANGNRTALTPPGRPAHQFRYTAVDGTDQYQAPDLGAGTAATDYRYNFDRQVTLVSRPDGRDVSVNYDGAGRVHEVLFSEGALAFGYSTATGNLETIDAPGPIALRQEYDGSLPTRTIWTGAVVGSVDTTYDNNFRAVSGTINGAQPIASSYDQDGLLTQAGDLTITRGAASGLITGTQLGQVTTSQSYNAFNEMVASVASYAGIPLLAVDYTRDKVGRITRRVETIEGVTSTYDYAYDSAGRLADVSKDGAPLSHYEYDANSNRTSYRAGSSAPIVGAYDAQDRLLTYGSTSYTYSQAGDLESKSQGGSSANYSYDEFGNLRSAVPLDGIALDYAIDGQNRRVGKEINGTLVNGFLYRDQLKVVAELDAAGGVVSRFVHGVRPNAPEYFLRGGQRYRILSDHLGSPRLIVNSADGSIAQRMDYDEFGRVILDTNPGFQPFGFAGGHYDPQTGLVRFGARDYDAETGRWTRKDPILFAGGQLNLYAYSAGDPINRSDPSGLDTFYCEYSVQSSPIPGLGGNAFVGAGFDTDGNLFLMGGIGWGVAAGSGQGPNIGYSTSPTNTDLGGPGSTTNVGTPYGGLALTRSGVPESGPTYEGVEYALPSDSPTVFAGDTFTWTAEYNVLEPIRNFVESFDDYLNNLVNPRRKYPPFEEDPNGGDACGCQ